MIASVSTLEAYGYLVVVAMLVLTVFAAVTIALAVFDGIMVARWYYRAYPTAVPPDKFWVRVSLLGVRPWR